MTTPLEQKLEVFDRKAWGAVDDLARLLVRDRQRLIALARERHIEGHHEYGDTEMREWSDSKLDSERDDEVADWLVYRVEQLRREEEAKAA